MPSLNIKRRTGSLDDVRLKSNPIPVPQSPPASIGRYRTKPLPQSPVPSAVTLTRKGSYSLYPSCPPAAESSTNSSTSKPLPIPQLPPRPATASRIRLPFWRRASATKMTTSASTPDLHAEPLVNDIETMAGSLPGLDRDMPAVPFFDHAASPDVKKIRTLHSADHQHKHDSHHRSYSEADFLAAASSNATSPEMRSGGSTDDSASEISTAPSEPTLVPLQTHGVGDAPDQLEGVAGDDPKSFDLLAAPPSETRGSYEIENRADQLFSQDHLRHIFADPKLLFHFTSFLNSHRPRSLRILTYYLDSIKALRAINYANAITEALDPLHGHDFTKTAPPFTANKALEERAEKAFEALAREELPAYIAYTWIQVVSESMQRRITGTLAPHLREASEGLAEVFCLTDPSRPDNPIVFASEEFQRTTQYGMNYCVGRNCRFLQGPRTNPDSIRRISEACKSGKEHSEVFLNYRRDGQPFMNLLMTAPLHDSQGTVRYFIGAQVDVSGLVKDSTDLEGMKRLLARQTSRAVAEEQDVAQRKEEFQALTEMMNNYELGTVRKYGGRMHQPHVDEMDDDAASVGYHRPRLVLTDPTTEQLDRSTASMPKTAADIVKASIRDSGRLQGVYQNYLLIRPAPSLRILFTSPSLRIPGILQSPFLDRIGGSSRVRNELNAAFTEGRGVTAKIRWLTRPHIEGSGAAEPEGRSRWIHCTPLLNHKGAVGVWMVVLVDADSHEGDGRRRFRAPPTVPAKDDAYTPVSRPGSRGTTGTFAGSNGVSRNPSNASRLTIGGSSMIGGSGLQYISTAQQRSRPTSPMKHNGFPSTESFRKQNVNFMDELIANRF